jgi:hypothetical protein
MHQALRIHTYNATPCRPIRYLAVMKSVNTNVTNDGPRPTGRRRNRWRGELETSAPRLPCVPGPRLDSRPNDLTLLSPQAAS